MVVFLDTVFANMHDLNHPLLRCINEMVGFGIRIKKCIHLSKESYKAPVYFK